MTARDDYHHLVDNAHRTGALGAQDCDWAMDEIDRLRRLGREAAQAWRMGGLDTRTRLGRAVAFEVQDWIKANHP